MLDELEKLLPLTDEYDLIFELTHGPETIRTWQQRYDEAIETYERVASYAAMDALKIEIFTDKKGEKVTASNDTERKTAIDFNLTHTPDVISARVNLSIQRNGLQEAKNRFEAARLLVQLLCRSNPK